MNHLINVVAKEFFLHNLPLLLTLLYLPRAVSDCLPLIYEMNLSLIDHYLLGMDDEEEV